MWIKALNIILALVMIFSLAGCSNSQESGFPTTFARVSDGVQISLGMHRDDVEKILENWVHYNPKMSTYEDELFIVYNYEDIVIAIDMETENWTFAGISVGDEIRSLYDNDIFSNPNYGFKHLEGISIDIVDDRENITYLLMFSYNDEEAIDFIGLLNLPMQRADAGVLR